MGYLGTVLILRSPHGDIEIVVVIKIVGCIYVTVFLYAIRGSPTKG
jgi:hypothetical protein